MNLRNVAIIAHVDHGKTTLVDGFLKQSKMFRENEAYMSQELIMDSNDQERERGITILAKNTSIQYKETKINIIDTPGHADFGGEVERTLNMADGAILVIDAKEGPMPQTKFVLKKALELGLKIIVVFNKIDKPNFDMEKTLNDTYDLFLDLAQNDSQLEFPHYFAIGREGKAWKEIPQNMDKEADLSPILDAVLECVPSPDQDYEGGFQMLVSALDWDNFMGKYVIGKIKRGVVKTGMPIVLMGRDGKIENSRIEKIYVNSGLKKTEVHEAVSGDVVSITGIKNAGIGDTVSDANQPEILPTIAIEEPTMNISIYANTSPFAGREGKFVTARQIQERIEKELQTNVAMAMKMANNGEFIVSGRGELHLSVFIETLRREGYELQVGKPQVIIKEVDGVLSEPIEELTIDVENGYSSAVAGEVGRRRGVMKHQSENSDGTMRLVFDIAAKNTLGLQNTLLTLSKGTAVSNSIFLRFEPVSPVIPKLRNGALVAYETGKAVTYGLDAAQQRGITFIPPQMEVYGGMIVGLNSREDDLEINVCKEKKLTNTRSSNADMATILTPPTTLSLEQCLDFLEDDELLEVTPSSLRLRKKILDSSLRAKARKG